MEGYQIPEHFREIIPQGNPGLEQYLATYLDLLSLSGITDGNLTLKVLRERTKKMRIDDGVYCSGEISEGIERVDRVVYQQIKAMEKLARTLNYDAGLRHLGQQACQAFEGPSYPADDERDIGMQVVYGRFSNMYIDIADAFEEQAQNDNTDWTQWLNTQLTQYAGNLRLEIPQEELNSIVNKLSQEIKRAKDSLSLVQNIATRMTQYLVDSYVLSQGSDNFTLPEEIETVLGDKQVNNDPTDLLQALQEANDSITQGVPDAKAFKEWANLIEGTIEEQEPGSTHTYLQKMADLFRQYAPKDAPNIYPNAPSRAATAALIEAGHRDIAPITWNALEAPMIFNVKEALERKMRGLVHAYNLMEALWKSPSIVAEHMGVSEKSEEYGQIMAFHNQLQFLVSYKSFVSDGVQSMPYSAMPFTFSRPDIALTPGEDGKVKLVETEAENAPGGLGMSQLQTEAEGFKVTTVDEMYQFMQNMPLPKSISAEGQQKMRSKIIVYMCRDTHGGWADYETEAWVFCNAMKQKYQIESEVIMLEDLVEGKQKMEDLEDAMVFYFTYPDVEYWSEETADISLLFEPDLFARTMGMDLKDLVNSNLLNENGEVDRAKLETALEGIKAKQKKEFKRTMAVPVDMLREEIMKIYKDGLNSMQSQSENYSGVYQEVAQLYIKKRAQTADTMKRMDNDSIYMFNKPSPFIHSKLGGAVLELPGFRDMLNTYMQAQGVDEVEQAIQTLYDMTAPSDILINPDDLNDQLDDPGMAELQRYAQEVLDRCKVDPDKYVLKVAGDQQTVAMHTWGTRGVEGEMENPNQIDQASRSNIPFVIQGKMPHARFKRSRRGSRQVTSMSICPNTDASGLPQLGFYDPRNEVIRPGLCDLRLNVFACYVDGAVSIGSGLVTATPPRGGKAGQNGWNMAHGTGHSAERAAHIQ